MTVEEIKIHKIAAKKLGLIKDRAFEFISSNLGKIADNTHCHAGNSKIKKNQLIITVF